MALKEKLKQKVKHIVSFLIHGEPDNITANIITLAPSELLKGRCALITGGGRGLGYYIAKAFLNAGASVVITGRSQEHLDSAVKTLGCKGRVYAFVMDNTKVETFEPTFLKMLETVKRGGGKLH